MCPQAVHTVIHRPARQVRDAARIVESVGLTRCMATADGRAPMRQPTDDTWPGIVGKAIDVAAEGWGEALRLCLVVVVASLLLVGIGMALTAWLWLSHAR